MYINKKGVYNGDVLRSGSTATCKFPIWRRRRRLTCMDCHERAPGQQWTRIGSVRRGTMQSPPCVVDFTLAGYGCEFSLFNPNQLAIAASQYFGIIRETAGSLLYRKCRARRRLRFCVRLTPRMGCVTVLGTNQMQTKSLAPVGMVV